jgi:sugar-phosphatase
MMKRLDGQALIFDLDGVLIDSSAVIDRNWRYWAEAQGLDVDELRRVLHGRRMVEIVRMVAPHLDAEAETARLSAREARDTDGLVRIEGAARLIRSLPERAWAVATSGNRETATTRLRYAGLPVPAVLVTADDVARGKPDPQAYLLAAGRLGVSPPECIVVEDAPAGVEAALAAGMRVIAVATTHPPEALARADAVAARLLDIQVSAADELRVTVTRRLPTARNSR